MKNKSINGAAGEHHVLSQLLRRGWVAAQAPDGAPNMDILVTDKNSEKLRTIQVKTRRDGPGKGKGWPMGRKHETIIVEDLFYIFVDLGIQSTDPINSYILPSRVVADCIRRCHQVWLDTPGRGGRPHKDSNIRKLYLDYSFIKPITEDGKSIIDQYRVGWLNQYHENWRILGLPEMYTF